MSIAVPAAFHTSITRGCGPAARIVAGKIASTPPSQVFTYIGRFVCRFAFGRHRLHIPRIVPRHEDLIRARARNRQRPPSTCRSFFAPFSSHRRGAAPHSTQSGVGRDTVAVRAAPHRQMRDWQRRNGRACCPAHPPRSPPASSPLCGRERRPSRRCCISAAKARSSAVRVCSPKVLRILTSRPSSATRGEALRIFFHPYRLVAGTCRSSTTPAIERQGADAACVPPRAARPPA